MPPNTTAEEAQTRFMHEFTPAIRRRADAYIARFNVEHAPATLTMRALVNAALVEYLDRRDDQEEAA